MQAELSNTMQEEYDQETQKQTRFMLTLYVDKIIHLNAENKDKKIYSNFNTQRCYSGVPNLLELILKMSTISEQNSPNGGTTFEITSENYKSGSTIPKKEEMHQAG